MATCKCRLETVHLYFRMKKLIQSQFFRGLIDARELINHTSIKHMDQSNIRHLITFFLRTFLILILFIYCNRTINFIWLPRTASLQQSFEKLARNCCYPCCCRLFSTHTRRSKDVWAESALFPPLHFVFCLCYNPAFVGRCRYGLLALPPKS